MIRRTYIGYYRLVRTLRRSALRISVYRYGRSNGVEVFTARPKRRNADGPGCICFELTLGEALERRAWRPKCEL
jgi:hypothetical protein